MNKNNIEDWNSINIRILLVTGHTCYQKEVTKFYNRIQPYILWYVKGDEELTNDIVLRILNKLDLYNNKRSQLHNFIYTIIKNEYINAQKEKKNVNQFVNVSLAENFYERFNQEIEYAHRPTEQKQKLEKLISKLNKQEQAFIENYTHNEIDKDGKNRKRFCLLVNKLKKFNETFSDGIK